MTLPTFLVIGAMKAGTTTLRDQLARHPDVFMSTPKELHFFSGRNWDRGPDWYADQFTPGETAIARGEASPSYSQRDIFPAAAERIVDMLPGVRLVYVVRHPVERMRSMYLHQRANGRETRPIVEALTTQPYYLNTSRYSWQLDRYLEALPADRVHVVTTDALAADPRRAVGSVLRFVGVDPERVVVEPLHQGRSTDKRVTRPSRRVLAKVPGYRRAVAWTPDGLRRRARRLTTRPIDPAMAQLPASLEAELGDRLRDDVAGLRRFLGEDFDGWGLLAPVS